MAATAAPTTTGRHTRRWRRGRGSAERTEKGVGFARAPALVLGTVLLAAGLYFLYKQHGFTRFSNFPDGRAPVQGKAFGLFGLNGWTGELTAIAGGLLLFGSAHHLLAKATSLLVGLALGVAAIIALISGDVLGLAAANHWTELGWGVAAVILVLNSGIPRRRRVVAVPATTAAAPASQAPADAPTRVHAGGPDEAATGEPTNDPTTASPLTRQ